MGKTRGKPRAFGTNLTGQGGRSSILFRPIRQRHANQQSGRQRLINLAIKHIDAPPSYTGRGLKEGYGAALGSAIFLRDATLHLWEAEI